METEVASHTSLKLDDQLKCRVQQLAQIRRRSFRWIVREAIEQYVEREEKREVLRIEALGARDEYQATGMHATIHEVEQWLSTWGADDEQAAPECHR